MMRVSIVHVPGVGAQATPSTGHISHEYPAGFVCYCSLLTYHEASYLTRSITALLNTCFLRGKAADLKGGKLARFRLLDTCLNSKHVGC